MENECEALPGVAYPGVRDNRSTLNTKTGYDDDDGLLGLWNGDEHPAYAASEYGPPLPFYGGVMVIEWYL